MSNEPDLSKPWHLSSAIRNGEATQDDLHRAADLLELVSSVHATMNGREWDSDTLDLIAESFELYKLPLENSDDLSD